MMSSKKLQWSSSSMLPKDVMITHLDVATRLQVRRAGHAGLMHTHAIMARQEMGEHGPYAPRGAASTADLGSGSGSIATPVDEARRHSNAASGAGLHSPGYSPCADAASMAHYNLRGSLGATSAGRRRRAASVFFSLNATFQYAATLFRPQTTLQTV